MSEAYGFSRFGGPDVQEFLDRPDPVPGPMDVLIRVTAAGVNPLDHKLRDGTMPEAFGDRPFPYVMGAEAAGVALSVGSDVEGIAVNDAVFGFAAPGVGTYATTSLLVGPLTARKPEGLSDPWAATVPIARATAANAMDQVDLPGGSTVLINGVGGGVGLAAAQVARLWSVCHR